MIKKYISLIAILAAFNVYDPIIASGKDKDTDMKSLKESQMIDINDQENLQEDLSDTEFADDTGDSGYNMDIIATINNTSENNNLSDNDGSWEDNPLNNLSMIGSHLIDQVEERFGNNDNVSPEDSQPEEFDNSDLIINTEDEIEKETQVYNLPVEDNPVNTQETGKEAPLVESNLSIKDDQFDVVETEKEVPVPVLSDENDLPLADNQADMPVENSNLDTANKMDDNIPAEENNQAEPSVSPNPVNPNIDVNLGSKENLEKKEKFDLRVAIQDVMNKAKALPHNSRFKTGAIVTVSSLVVLGAGYIAYKTFRKSQAKRKAKSSNLNSVESRVSQDSLN